MKKRAHIRHKYRQTGSPYKTYLLAAILSAVIILTISGLWALLILKGWIPQSRTMIGALAAVAVGSFCGCLVIQSGIEKRKLLSGYLFVCGELIIAVLMQVILIKGNLTTVVPITVSTLLAASTAGCLQAIPKKRRR